MVVIINLCLGVGFILLNSLFVGWFLVRDIKVDFRMVERVVFLGVVFECGLIIELFGVIVVNVDGGEDVFCCFCLVWFFIIWENWFCEFWFCWFIMEVMVVVRVVVNFGLEVIIVVVVVMDFVKDGCNVCVCGLVGCLLNILFEDFILGWCCMNWLFRVFVGEKVLFKFDSGV